MTAKPASPQSVLPSIDSGRPDPLLAALATADLRDLAGARFDLASLPGPRHIVFWAPWCNTCRSEFGALNDLHRAHRDTGAGVLGIAVLDEHGPTVEETVAQLKPEFPILTLPRADYDRLFGKDAAVPRAIVVDGTRVAAVLEGRLRPYLVRSFLIEALRGR